VLMKQRAGMAELDEDAGPLEATIVSIKKEIHNKQSECAELQRTWITMQTELVSVQNANNAISEAQHEQRARLAILEQKKLRIASHFETENKELREIERLTGGLHIEMGKINRLVAEHAEKQVALADDNFLMETGFVEQLKELEKEAVGMESKIIQLKEEKERLLLDVTEAEKQVMLLEKKIALERETQAALDPEVGAAEVRAMEREIHRMRLRYAQLQRRQEQMIAEMERAIYKRDNIEAKGKVASGKKGAPPTQAALAKQVGDLSKRLQSTTHDANVTQLAVLKLQEGQQAKGVEVETSAAETRQASADVDAAREALISAKQLEGVRAAQIRTQAGIAARLQAAAQGRYEPTASEDVLRERIASADDTSARLLSVVESLSAEAPQYANVLSSVVQAVLSASA